MKKLVVSLSVLLFVGCEDTPPTTGQTSTKPSALNSGFNKPSIDEADPVKVDANDVLNEAIAMAVKDNKRVFVHLGTPF